MLRQSLVNIGLTVYTLFLALWHRVPGWRYPLVSYTAHGNTHRQTQAQVETIGFNTIKHHYVQDILKRLTEDYVIVTSFHNSHLRLNVHRIVMDKNQTDLSIPTNGTPGETGHYHYLLLKGVLYHALRPTSWSRQRGFFMCEPVMSYQLYLTERQQLELDDLLLTEQLEGVLSTQRVVNECTSPNWHVDSTAT